MNFSCREEILCTSKVTMWTEVHERLPKKSIKKIFLSLIFLQNIVCIVSIAVLPKKQINFVLCYQYCLLARNRDLITSLTLFMKFWIPI